MKKILLRIDEEIAEKIKHLAEENRRSINGEIDYAIRKYILEQELKRHDKS